MIPYRPDMPQTVILSLRDLALLRFLDLTPASAPQLRKVSVTFGEDPFRDERRVRERMQALSEANLTKSFPAAVPGGGLMSYYRLTFEGYRAAFPENADSPPRTSLSEIAPSRVRHAIITAEVIAYTLVACHEQGVQVLKTTGDGRLTLSICEHRQQPDFHIQLAFAGRLLNLVFEIDNATEPLDSQREQSIRTKILGYETYQDWVLNSWKESGCQGPRPAFRVIFLTTGSQRANHILWLAQELARVKRRHLIYTTTQDQFLREPHAVTQPIFNDHHGHWQALVDPQPTSGFARDPIRLARPIVPASSL